MASARSTLAAARFFFVEEGSLMYARSEAEAHGKVQPHALGPHAVGDVGAKRPDGGAPAPAEAGAVREDEGVAVIERVAGIHERRGAPASGEPVGGLGAQDRQIAAADDRVALRHADRLVRVAADRLVAAGPEQEGG